MINKDKRRIRRKGIYRKTCNTMSRDVIVHTPSSNDALIVGKRRYQI